MRSPIFSPALAASLALGLMIAPLWAGHARAQVTDNSFCLDGTARADQQSVGCSGRWVAADGTRFGQRADPRNTPHTPYPGAGRASTSHYGQSGSATTHYHTYASHVPVQTWSPPAPYAQGYGYQAGGPVVITRGTHTSVYESGHETGYDTYVPVYPHAASPYCTAHQGRGGSYAGHCAPVSPPPPVTCSSHCYAAPIEGCFSLDEAGRAHSVACPSGGHALQSHAVYSRAEASVHISNAGFFNSLSGGVGGALSSFYGGGGSFSGGGGGGSVLSRAPLIRFGGHHGHHGGGHMCPGCGGMGHGGGD